MTTASHHPDAIVVGAGLAGFSTALALAERGRRVLVLSPDAEAVAGVSTSSALAQGGLAAAMGAGDDPALHAADTVAAGVGLTEPEVARSITAAAPGVVDHLLALGADFDRAPDGTLRLGLEGAHGRHRIVHAHGDGSGAEILRVVAAAAVAHPGVTVRGSARVRRLVARQGQVTGVEIDCAHATAASDAETIHADAVVLATGGIGGLFAHTTNPVTSWGSGLALGLRAGARARDLEMVQFHPTALDVGLDPMPLVSEAVRGEGVALVLDDGTPLPDPLAGRDIVARAVWGALRAGHRVYLDVPGGPAHLRADFAGHFPAIHAACAAAGLDPSVDRLPVRPAAHYHMGGLAVDDAGRTDVPGLWAVGEVASTGLHGANRLASNSLLEAVVCGDRVGTDIHDVLAGRSPLPVPALARPSEEPTGATGGPTPEDRLLLEECAGLYRDGEGLRRAARRFTPGAAADDAHLVAAMLAVAALQRTESRGAHQRLDHPATADAHHTSVDLTWLDEPARCDRSAS